MTTQSSRFRVRANLKHRPDRRRSPRCRLTGINNRGGAKLRASKPQMKWLVGTVRKVLTTVALVDTADTQQNSKYLSIGLLGYVGGP